MTLATAKTVRDYALEAPQAIRVFEKLGIDYCCGGKRPLEEACAAANLSLGDVLLQLEAATAEPLRPSDQELRAGSLAELIAYIVNTHHVFLRSEIPQLDALIEKVCSKHSANHPELLQVRDLFHALGQELLTHLMKEEMILFPYVERMEEAILQHEPILPAPFGTVANPVHAMEHEHDNAGAALRALREASHDYTPPADACTNFRALYAALSAFEKDLHQHIHLENNLLFPRAQEMESSSRQVA